MPSAMVDEDLVNALAQYLDFEPLEKAGAAREGRPSHPRRSLVELRRNENHDGADPGLSNVAH